MSARKGTRAAELEARIEELEAQVDMLTDVARVELDGAHVTCSTQHMDGIRIELDALGQPVAVEFLHGLGGACWSVAE